MAVAALAWGAQALISRHIVHTQLKSIATTVLRRNIQMGQGLKGGAISVSQLLKPFHNLTVPGSQADYFVHWLAAQTAVANGISPLHLRSTHLFIRHQTATQGPYHDTVTLSFTAVRHFWPKGSSLTKGTATMWIVRPGTKWQVESLSFNYSPVIKPGQPSSFNPDVWNLSPAPPFPLGQ